VFAAIGIDCVGLEGATGGGRKWTGAQCAADGDQKPTVVVVHGGFADSGLGDEVAVIDSRYVINQMERRRSLARWCR
jgi:hypothetical protein